MYLRQEYVFSAPSWSTGARRIRRGVGDLKTVADKIQSIEGWYPGSVSYRNNNPGNLRYPTPILGATSVDQNGFLVFPDYATGRAAEEHQITLDASRGMSILDFTNKYAPASDSNDPSSYAASIADASGVSMNDPLSAAIDSSGSPLSFLPSFDLSSMLPADAGSWITGLAIGLGLLVAFNLVTD